MAAGSKAEGFHRALALPHQHGLRPGQVDDRGRFDAARARGERRGIERLQTEKIGGLKHAIDEPASEQNFLLPREAGGMTLFLLAAYAVSAVAFQGLPSTHTLGAALASAALFACGSLFAATGSLAGSYRSQYFFGALNCACGFQKPTARKNG